jgi:hypothetical protein
LFRPTNALSLFASAFVFGFALIAFSTSAYAADEVAEEPYETLGVMLDTARVGNLADNTTRPAAAPLILAQSGGDAGRSRPLEPRYQPREPEPRSWYDSSYIFALTRGVADSNIAPAGQVPLYVLTVPLDIALLPFALIGGLFG